MAGYVIHLAVAEEYIRKHREQIEDYNKFIEGVIYPDSVQDKSLTHYGEKSSKVHLEDFLQEHEIENCFEKGYFLHLITDYLFYNNFLKYFSKDIYEDYDISNNYLVEKYNVNIPENIKDKVSSKDGETKLFTMQEISDFIEMTSNYNIEDVKREVLNNNKFWTTIINLEHR